jgi:pyruvate,water dikinase
VVVINGPQDFPKFSRGKIMVTQMTTPDFVPVMEKARAIVTDIGGITTHAAIVSRELGVTCIIGTEKGTKVFKDGDLVLVNTDDSTVRKLTRAEFEKLERELALEAKGAVKAEKKRTVQAVELRGDLVMDFSITKKQHLPLVGGKGASLGEMFGKFPVPDGYVVTTNTYKAFIEETGLQDKIHHLLEKLDPEDTAALEKTAQQIQDLITSAKLSPEHQTAILESYGKLGEGFVAVRSSATAEDLPGASFAGLQATFLNVKGRRDVIEAVKGCWASLFTPRAILYRSVKKFEHEKVHMAVVIQNMVDSAKAGVLFTANPVTKNLDEMIIEGSWGLGESVVSGQVTPDGFVVDKLDLTIKDRHEGDKKTAIVRDPKTGKNLHKELPPEEAQKVCLSDHEVQELARIGKHVEEHYGSPQDIEWAIDAKGKFYVLQSRPITTL